jgi:hypothetical protein
MVKYGWESILANEVEFRDLEQFGGRNVVFTHGSAA